MEQSLLYISNASRELHVDDIKYILEHAAATNISKNISGFLLYKNDNFVQLLEGSKEIVEETYQKISRDDRHDNAIILLREQIRERNFKGYRSAFNVFDNNAEFEDFELYINNIAESTKPENATSLKLIRGIIKNM